VCGDWFKNSITHLGFDEFKFNWYQSIALNELYNFAFECVLIWRSVRPQIDENWRRVSAILRDPMHFRDFEDERLIRSIYTQKAFDRKCEELSIDIKLSWITLNLNELIKIVENDSNGNVNKFDWNDQHFNSWTEH
jgi:hypothetical protein